MKKATIARFVIGLAAISAVGCSAETGAPGVGESSQALSGTAPAVATSSLPAGLDTYDTDTGTGGIQPPDGRIFAASCVIHDGSTDKLVVAGGYNSVGTALDDILVYTPGTPGSWTSLTKPTLTAKLTHARGDLKAIQVPGVPAKCLFVGGSTSSTAGAALADVDELSVSGGVFAINAKQPLNTPRSNFGLSTCGGSQIIVVGGRDNATKIKSIEVSDSFAPTAWANYTSTPSPQRQLVRGRWDFGFVKDPNADQYMVAGGRSTSGAQDNTIEIIKTATVSNVTCVPTVSLMSGTGKVLSAAVEGNVAFFEGTADHFLVAGGYDGSTFPTATNEVTVTWATPTVSVAAGSALVVGTYRPTVVETASDAHLLIGGGDAGGSVFTTPTATNSAVGTNGAQQYQDTFGFLSDSLHFADRFGAVAELIGGKVYAPTGRSFGSPDYLLNVEKITP